MKNTAKELYNKSGLRFAGSCDMQKKILILEDSREILGLLNSVLEEEGYFTICHDLLGSAAGYLKTNIPDMAILDITLPDGNGLELAEKIRGRAETRRMPIIALTGRDGLGSKKEAFSAGVDQYLVKPVDMAELVLWVKSLFRRVELDSDRPRGINAGDMEVDKECRLVRYKGKIISNLTNREFELLSCLVEHSPKIISREYIMAKVWRTVAVPNLVDTHVHNLRRKLPEHAALKVQVVPGKGFRYFDV